jgi:hypothetical protein
MWQVRPWLFRLWRYFVSKYSINMSEGRGPQLDELVDLNTTLPSINTSP